LNPLVVHIAETKDFSPEVIRELKDLAYVIEKPIGANEVKEALENCDVFWFRLGFRISKNEITTKTRCKFIVCPVTGLDHIDLNVCKLAGIRVISLKGETEFLKSVRATAELTIGLAISVLRRIPQAVNSTRSGIWERDQFKGNEIFGKNVGIIGVGRLGTLVSTYLKGFGANVYGFDKSPVDASTCTPVGSLEELLQISDIISIHLSYNESTHHFMNTKQFDLMKYGSVLINTARGAIVESHALIEALKSGRVKAAGIDVIENEFDPSSDVLIDYARQHDNLIITPHIGGNTSESFLKTEAFMLRKLKENLNVAI
jgi:D-3-phosphoglycerate dehydrogenase / 2-oxoglutarate reductase